MKKKILFSFGVFAITAIFLINVAFVMKSNNSIISLFSLNKTALAVEEGEDDYSQNYANYPEDCTITESVEHCIFIYVYPYGEIEFCWHTQEDFDGTMNYCQYTGNPENHCSFHKCEKN